MSEKPYLASGDSGGREMKVVMTLEQMSDIEDALGMTGHKHLASMFEKMIEEHHEGVYALGWS